MKALSLLIALHVCLSSGVQWGTVYKYPAYTNNGNNYLRGKVREREDVINIYSDPIDKNHAGNELPSNNGVQNNLSFNNRQVFSNDQDEKRGVKKVNNYVLFLNKNNSDPFPKSSARPLLGSNPGSVWWVNENNQNYKESYWYPPRPSWNQRPTPLLPNPVVVHPKPDVYYPNNNNNFFPHNNNGFYPDNNNGFYPDNNNGLYPDENNGFYPDNNNGFYPDHNNGYYPDGNNGLNPDGNSGFYPDKNVWNQVDLNECYKLADIIGELRVLVQKNNINEEKHNLKTLFKVIRIFISNNNLQHKSFRVVVREIEKVLLNGHDNSNSLRENDIARILQEFKNRDMKSFLLEIRSNPKVSLHVVVSKLALLLYRLKQVLIQRKYSQDIIKVVINRAVQWSVPLVGYYIEKECKIKTQQYIVQNLEVALNINLESVKRVVSLDEVQADLNIGNLGHLGGLEGIGGLGNIGGLGGGNLGGPGNQGNLEGPLNIGTSGLAGIGNQAYPGALAGALNSKNA